MDAQKKLIFFQLDIQMDAKMLQFLDTTTRWIFICRG